MTWNLTVTTEQLYPFLPPRETECMTNEDGVRILVFGREKNGCQTVFIYEYLDVKFQFKAHQSSRDWVSYIKPGTDDRSDFALGPSCTVWLDIRGLRQLSDREVEIIEHNISDFLINEFHRYRMAISPNAETVEYY
jgi:hypothetical protein